MGCMYNLGNPFGGIVLAPPLEAPPYLGGQWQNTSANALLDLLGLPNTSVEHSRDRCWMEGKLVLSVSTAVLAGVGVF